jgi:hypothetical protein
MSGVRVPCAARHLSHGQPLHPTQHRCRRCRRGCQSQHTAVLMRVSRCAPRIYRDLIRGLFPRPLDMFRRGVYQLTVLGTQVMGNQQKVQRRNDVPDPEQHHERHPSGQRPRSPAGLGSQTRHVSELTGYAEAGQARPKANSVSRSLPATRTQGASRTPSSQRIFPALPVARMRPPCTPNK